MYTVGCSYKDLLHKNKNFVKLNLGTFTRSDIMTISLRDLYRKLLEKLRKQKICGICRKPFTEGHLESGDNTFDGGPVNDDCYYDDFGNGIEQYPIVSPEMVMRMRRRHQN